MGTAHSLRKLVKETSTSTCTRIVDDSADRIAVKVNEHSTDWVKPLPILRRRFPQGYATALRMLNCMQAIYLGLVCWMVSSEPASQSRTETGVDGREVRR
jgi:hypothetical protein